MLGTFNDQWYRWVVDVGMTGPDKGRAGQYLILPSGYQGEVSDGYFVARSKAYEMFLAFRTFPDEKGDLKPQVALTKARTRIFRPTRMAPSMYFLVRADNPKTKISSA